MWTRWARRPDPSLKPPIGWGSIGHNGFSGQNRDRSMRLDGVGKMEPPPSPPFRPPINRPPTMERVQPRGGHLPDLAHTPSSDGLYEISTVICHGDDSPRGPFLPGSRRRRSSRLLQNQGLRAGGRPYLVGERAYFTIRQAARIAWRLLYAEDYGGL